MAGVASGNCVWNWGIGLGEVEDELSEDGIGVNK